MTSMRHLLTLMVLGSYCFLYCDAEAVTIDIPDHEAQKKVISLCELPNEMKVDIKMDDKTVRLSLNRTRGVGENAEVFLMEKDDNGVVKFVREIGATKLSDFVYQDVLHQAEFTVSCKEAETIESALRLMGSFDLPDGKVYSLDKSESDNSYNLVEERLDDVLTLTAKFNDEKEDLLNTRYERAAVSSVIQNDVFIDVIALIEYTVYQRWYSRAKAASAAAKRTETVDNIRSHFAHLFNAVDVRYKTASPKLNVDLAGFIIETTPHVRGDWYQTVKAQERDQSKINAQKLLNSMNTFAQSPDFPFPEYDHLVSFTTDDQYWPGGDIAGLAKVAQICKVGGSSVSTVEYQDNLIVVAAITAHEIGHCLSAGHDGRGNSCDSADNFIMAVSSRPYTNTNPFTFSACSAKYFGTHINRLLNSGEQKSIHCLTKSLSSTGVPDVSNEILGQEHDVDEQCKMIYGQASYHCKGMDISSTSVCLAMYCSMSPTSTSCAKRYAAPGTTCGDRKWCQGGKCVFSPKAPRVDRTCIHGDQTGPIAGTGKTCSQLVKKPQMCANASVRRFCCQWCKRFDPPCRIFCRPPKIRDNLSCTCVDRSTMG